jgi:hypothetical protein
MLHSRKVTCVLANGICVHCQSYAVPECNYTVLQMEGAQQHGGPEFGSYLTPKYLYPIGTTMI